MEGRIIRDVTRLEVKYVPWTSGSFMEKSWTVFAVYVYMYISYITSMSPCVALLQVPSCSSKTKNVGYCHCCCRPTCAIDCNSRKHCFPCLHGNGGWTQEVWAGFVLQQPPQDWKPCFCIKPSENLLQEKSALLLNGLQERHFRCKTPDCAAARVRMWSVWYPKPRASNHNYLFLCCCLNPAHEYIRGPHGPTVPRRLQTFQSSVGIVGGACLPEQRASSGTSRYLAGSFWPEVWRQTSSLTSHMCVYHGMTDNIWN